MCIINLKLVSKEASEFLFRLSPFVICRFFSVYCTCYGGFQNNFRHRRLSKQRIEFRRLSESWNKLPEDDLEKIAIISTCFRIKKAETQFLTFSSKRQAKVVQTVIVWAYRISDLIFKTLNIFISRQIPFHALQASTFNKCKCESYLHTCIVKDGKSVSIMFLY